VSPKETLRLVIEGDNRGAIKAAQDTRKATARQLHEQADDQQRRMEHNRRRLAAIDEDLERPPGRF
jgi:hypothetical protein